MTKNCVVSVPWKGRGAVNSEVIFALLKFSNRVGEKDVVRKSTWSGGVGGVQELWGVEIGRGTRGGI
jgi:hypothetical protein